MGETADGRCGRGFGAGFHQHMAKIIVPHRNERRVLAELRLNCLGTLRRRLRTHRSYTAISSKRVRCALFVVGNSRRTCTPHGLLARCTDISSASDGDRSGRPQPANRQTPRDGHLETPRSRAQGGRRAADRQARRTGGAQAVQHGGPFLCGRKAERGRRRIVFSRALAIKLSRVAWAYRIKKQLETLFAQLPLLYSKGASRGCRGWIVRGSDTGFRCHQRTTP